LKIYVVLVEPEEDGNIGAIARVMKNFGFKELVLVNPKCKIGQEAYVRAMHAKDVLKGAKIVEEFDPSEYDFVVGTTAKGGGFYNVRRFSITPRELKGKLSGKVAILFGRESIGLKNEELKMCDLVVRIPTSKKYPTMNVSHACAILLYELSRLKEERRLAKRQEREAVLKMAEEVLSRVKFRKTSQRKTILLTLRRVLGRAELRKREAYTLAGMFRSIRNAMKDEGS